MTMTFLIDDCNAPGVGEGIGASVGPIAGNVVPVPEQPAVKTVNNKAAVKRGDRHALKTPKSIETSRRKAVWPLTLLRDCEGTIKDRLTVAYRVREGVPLRLLGTPM